MMPTKKVEVMEVQAQEHIQVIEREAIELAVEVDLKQPAKAAGVTPQSKRDSSAKPDAP